MTFKPVENLFPSPESPHVGLSGNEKADVLAKMVIQLPPALPLQDYIPSIRRSISASWQFRWNQWVVDGDRLAQLKPSLGPGSFCSQRCRHIEVFLFHLRVGHTRLTHGHLMAREAPPVYGRCQVHLSVFHVLVECPDYFVPCNQFFPSLASVPARERLPFLLSESPTFSSSTLFAFLSVRPHV